jgi:hypothetical protein
MTGRNRGDLKLPHHLAGKLVRMWRMRHFAVIVSGRWMSFAAQKSHRASISSSIGEMTE